MSNVAIPIPTDAVAEFCRRHHIRKLSLFGSVLRADFGPDSDVDVLVEFEEGKTPGWEIVTMGEEMSEILGREVDFLTPLCLHERFREDVIRHAEVIYDNA